MALSGGESCARAGMGSLGLQLCGYPLVLSVLEAIKDFEKSTNGSIILITDGIENCSGDITSIGPAIKKSGLELKVHIVGFDIKEKESRDELEAIAKPTGGIYLEANNATELLTSLQQTLQVEYQIIDEKGAVAAKGFKGGEEVKLREGSYTLRILLAPSPLDLKVTVEPGTREAYVLKKSENKWTVEKK